jgi:hypothetical protein
MRLCARSDASLSARMKSTPLTPWLQPSQLRKHRGSQALSAVPVYKSLGSVAKNSLQQSNGLVFLQMLYSIANP